MSSQSHSPHLCYLFITFSFGVSNLYYICDNQIINNQLSKPSTWTSDTRSSRRRWGLWSNRGDDIRRRLDQSEGKIKKKLINLAKVQRTLEDRKSKCWTSIKIYCTKFVLIQRFYDSSELNKSDLWSSVLAFITRLNFLKRLRSQTFCCENCVKNVCDSRS